MHSTQQIIKRTIPKYITLNEKSEVNNKLKEVMYNYLKNESEDLSEGIIKDITFSCIICKTNPREMQNLEKGYYENLYYEKAYYESEYYITLCLFKHNNNFLVITRYSLESGGNSLESEDNRMEEKRYLKRTLERLIKNNFDEGTTLNFLDCNTKESFYDIKKSNILDAMIQMKVFLEFREKLYANLSDVRKVETLLQNLDFSINSNSWPLINMATGIDIKEYFDLQNSMLLMKPLIYGNQQLLQDEGELSKKLYSSLYGQLCKVSYPNIDLPYTKIPLKKKYKEASQEEIQQKINLIKPQFDKDKKDIINLLIFIKANATDLPALSEGQYFKISLAEEINKFEQNEISSSKEQSKLLNNILKAIEKFIICDELEIKMFSISEINDFLKSTVNIKQNHLNEHSRWQCSIKDKMKPKPNDFPILQMDKFQNCFHQSENINFHYNSTDIKSVGLELMKKFEKIRLDVVDIRDNEYSSWENILDRKDSGIHFFLLNIINNHWISLAIIPMQNQNIALYKDSMGDKYSSNREEIKKFLTKRIERFTFKFNSYPEQENSFSSGVFVLNNMVIIAEEIERNKDEFINKFEGYQGFTKPARALKLRKDEYPKLYEQNLCKEKFELTRSVNQQGDISNNSEDLRIKLPVTMESLIILLSRRIKNVNDLNNLDIVRILDIAKNTKNKDVAWSTLELLNFYLEKNSQNLLTFKENIEECLKNILAIPSAPDIAMISPDNEKAWKVVLIGDKLKDFRFECITTFMNEVLFINEKEDVRKKALSLLKSYIQIENGSNDATETTRKIIELEDKCLNADEAEFLESCLKNKKLTFSCFKKLADDNFFLKKEVLQICKNKDTKTIPKIFIEAFKSYIINGPIQKNTITLTQELLKKQYIYINDIEHFIIKAIDVEQNLILGLFSPVVINQGMSKCIIEKIKAINPRTKHIDNILKLCKLDDESDHGKEIHFSYNPIGGDHNKDCFAEKQTKVNTESAGIPSFIPQGLKFVDVPKDGNCLYNSVAIYLSQSVETLRQIVAANLEHNIEKYRSFIVLPIGITLEDYIEKIRSTNEWAGDLEITILSKLLNRPIISIGPNGNIINKQALDPELTEEPIFVYYDNVNHYDGLVLQNGSHVKEILDTLLQEETSNEMRGYVSAEFSLLKFKSS